MNSPHILVVGGAGYIGSHMVKMLAAQGYRVTTLDNLSTGYRDAIVAGEFIQADLADRPALDHLFAQQKIEAAKPPNQIAREYWQKQNNPYKDKWEELAHKIEKAGTPRGLQMETFKAADGTQITKLGDRCFKAPDPGRTYLHQAEARRVICPR